MQQTRMTHIAAGGQPLVPRARLRVTPQGFLALAAWIESVLILGAFLGTALALDALGSLEQHLIWACGAGAVAWGWRMVAPPARQLPLGGYDSSMQAAAHARRIGLVTIIPALGIGHALGGQELAIMVAAPLGLAALLIVLWRQYASRRMRIWIRSGRVGLHVVLAGGGSEARDTLQRLAAMRGQGVRVLGLFDDRELARSPSIQSGVPKMGRIAEMPAYLSQAAFDLVIVTMPPSAEERIGQMLAVLWEMPVDVRLSPVRSTLIYRPQTYQWLGDIALLSLLDRPLRARDVFIKRGFDVSLTSVLLTLLFPLLALIALAIKLDSRGPVFFRQAREGYASRPFLVWKFRTLYHDQADTGAVVPVTAGDRRVTRVGRWLRKTSLDELPQLFNVLEGNMSLVGPRPHAVGARNRDMAFTAVVRSYAARHRVKPGITGLAQVRGMRGPVQRPEDIQRRVALDLDYIDRWSLALDLRILILTLPSVLRGENAV
ncbi:MAG: exopolysaccharide biosynthesis polyprenyl glycosylphosphotransferase [Roseinatronobacter sp.]